MKEIFFKCLIIILISQISHCQIQKIYDAINLKEKTEEKKIKILALGDQICLGERNEGKGFVGDLGYEYDNIGVNSSSISTAMEDAKDIPTALGEYYNGNHTAPDIIISDGGINDYAYRGPMGEMPTGVIRTDEEAQKLNRGTVMGATQYLFYKMIQYYPKAYKFFLFTHKITRRREDGSSTDWTITPNGAGYTLTELYNNIKIVCKLYGIVPIDIYSKSLINTAFMEYVSKQPWKDNNTVTYSEFVDFDGLHPLDYGYKKGYLPFVKEALMNYVPNINAPYPTPSTLKRSSGSRVKPLMFILFISLIALI